jgi:replicative DNA helicase
MNNLKVNADFNLPQNLDLEHQIIGMTLEAERLRKTKVWQEFCTLKPEDFVDPMNQIAWAAVLRLHSAKLPVNVATVLSETQGDQLMKRLLVECACSIVSWVNAEEHARLLRDMADKRGMIYTCLEHADNAATLGYTRPAADLAGSAINDLQARLGGKRDLIGAEDLVDDILESLDKPVQATPTGLPRLDKILLGGFHRGRYYGLSATQKAGKSTLMGTTISYNMAIAKRPHVYIGLEMQSREIFQRYLARWMAEETGTAITSDAFYDREQTDQKWFRDCLHEAKEVFRFKNSGLQFLQRPRMHIDELKSTLARIGLSGEYEGVFIDYMQLVGGCKGENMVSHLDNVNQTLAEFVMSYPGMWVVAAAQENDDGSVRYGKGMRAAVDMLLSLQKFEFNQINDRGEEVPYYKSCIEMQATRYTQMMHIGTEREPAYDFDVGAGPCYRELAKPGPQLQNFMHGMQGGAARGQDNRRSF